MKKNSSVIIVTFTIEVEDIGEGGFSHDITTKINGLTKKTRALTQWEEDNVLWEIHQHIKDDLM